MLKLSVNAQETLFQLRPDISSWLFSFRLRSLLRQWFLGFLPTEIF